MVSLGFDCGVIAFVLVDADAHIAVAEFPFH